MTIKDSNLACEIEDIYVSHLGNFYFFNIFVVSEIHEGVNFTWEAAQNVMEACRKHYKNKPVTYIDNHINEYSIRPQDWKKIERSKFMLKAYIAVCYNKRSWLNALLVKAFLNTKFEYYNNLENAINQIKANNTQTLRIA